MMISPEHIVRLARLYSDATGASITSVSSRVFDDGKKLSAMIDNNADLTLRRAAKALEWFSENWPAGVDWPAEIQRPNQPEAA